MKTAIIFASTNGRTRRVVRDVTQQLAHETELFDAGAGVSLERLRGHAVWVFFAPTYGDEELQPALEEFVYGLTEPLDGRRFAVCEFGNYYGYDDMSFGAARIIRERLLRLRATELCEPASIDSFPQLDRGTLQRWTVLLDEKMNELD